MTDEKRTLTVVKYADRFGYERYRAAVQVEFAGREFDRVPPHIVAGFIAEKLREFFASVTETELAEYVVQADAEPRCPCCGRPMAVADYLTNRDLTEVER